MAGPVKQNVNVLDLDESEIGIDMAAPDMPNEGIGGPVIQIVAEYQNVPEEEGQEEHDAGEIFHELGALEGIQVLPEMENYFIPDKILKFLESDYSPDVFQQIITCLQNNDLNGLEHLLQLDYELNNSILGISDMEYPDYLESAI